MSSELQGRPLAVDMQTGIPCLTEPLARMTVGSKARITCPPHTGYAMSDKPVLIPTGSGLRFEIELIEVTPSLGTRHGSGS
jgi:FKBP-type peptidyl-prolyl cis-trans isomerase FkpA